jgi:serine/threonine protein kinase
MPPVDSTVHSLIIFCRPIQGEEVAIKCPKCNTDNPDTKSFCGDCGTRIVSIGDASVTMTLQTPTKGFKKDSVIANKYKIIEKVGEGGMGVVYKAEDARLDRSVALKFLPSELTSDKDAKKRFIQEAKAAAALNHPHICTIFEINDAEEQSFISMEYIDGQSLKDKLKDGPLDVDEAKDIAIQVAEGLNEAHEKGIVHRDIKPANIMLTEKGEAKITDFGLAKLSWGADLTKPSIIGRIYGLSVLCFMKCSRASVLSRKIRNTH